PGHFDEWYSPTYTLIWKAMIDAGARLGAGPFYQVSTMCILQTVLIVGALVYLLRAHGTTTWIKTGAFAAAVIVSPAIFVYFGEIWRDVLMAALLLVSVCLLDSFSRTESRITFVSAISVLFLAALIRQNAIIAEVPLFFWAALLLRRAGKRKYAYAAISTALVFMSFSVGWSAVNRMLAKTNLGRGASSIMYYDLMGISIRTNQLLLPRSLTVPGYSLETVRSRYQDEYNDLTGVILPTTAQEMQTVFKAWREAVLKHPEAYLEHRSVVMLRFLGIPNPDHLPYFYGIPESIYPEYIKDRSYYLRFPSTRVRKWEQQWL